MLVLTRKSNQSIMIGDEIEISVLSVMGDKVRIGIQAPRSVPVYRRESLRRTAERRAAKRRAERTIRQGRSRFIVLSVTLVATAVIVSVVMFRVLYLILE